VDIAQTIKQRAQERGVDPELALAIAQAESRLRPQVKNPKSSAHGLFQIVDDTWKQYGGDPKKRKDVNENIRIGLEILANNQQALSRTLGREPRPGELYAAHFFGTEGAKRVLTANPDAPVSSVVSARVLKANPELLQGKSVSQALSALSAKVGDTGPGQSIPRAPDQATARPVYREDPAKPPVISNAIDATNQYGPGYQAALALSYLSDTQEESDDPDAPSIVERDARDEMLEQQTEMAEASAAAAASGSRASGMLAEMDFGYAPVVGQQAPVKMAAGGFADLSVLERGAGTGVGIRPSFRHRIQTAEGFETQAEYDNFVKRARADAFNRSSALQQAQASGFFAEGGEVSDPEAQLIMGAEGRAVSPAQFGRGMMDTAAGMLKGSAQAAVGMPGDIESLIRMLAGSKGQTLPTTDRVKAFIDKYAPLGLPADEGTDGRTAAEYFGEFMSPAAATRPLVRGAQAVGSGVMEGAQRAEKALDPVVTRTMERGGRAAEMLEAFATTPAQAVRSKGTPFAMADYVSPPVDQPQEFVRSNLAKTGDPALDKWFNDKVTTYLRRDYASPDDSFVRAAEEGKLLHFADKPTKTLPVSPFNDPIQKMIRSYRKSEGFSPQGEARTPYGQRVEEIIDNTAQATEIQDTSLTQIPPFLRGANIAPETRLTRLEDFYLLGDDLIPRGESMDLIGLRDSMVKMRNMPSEFSAYNQPSIKVPKEYILTDEMLQGLTPAQASNRVALFNRWRDEARQKMASKAVNEDPTLLRTPMVDETGRNAPYMMVEFPDLRRNPAMQRLVTDVGCDGNWCTKGENYALSYGSGENRLAVVFDEKSRPRAQLTFTERMPSASEFLDSLPAEAQNRFFQANPHILPNKDGLVDIEDTREFMEYARRQPPRRKITELKGQNNTLDLTEQRVTEPLQKLLGQLADQGIEIPSEVLQQVDLDPWRHGRTQ